MGRLVAIALTLAVAGIVVIAVNGPGKDKPKTDRLTPKNESAQVISGGSAAAEGTVGEVHGKPDVIVRMKALRFHPAEVTVRAGAIVAFVNRDDVAHTVIEDVGSRSGVSPAFESQRILPGRRFEIRAGAAGTVVPFICTLHPTVMTGRIYVKGAKA